MPTRTPLGYPFLLSFLLFIGAGGCTEDQLVELAPLEREVLIVWVATERGDADVAAAYCRRARASWEQLNERHRNALPAGADTVALRKMDDWLAALTVSIRGGAGNAAGAYAELIVNELRALRPAHDIEHPADRLYDFYFAWERVRQTSNDQLLDLLEWREYTALYADALYEWRTFRGHSLQYQTDLFPGVGTSGGRAEAAGLEMEAALRDFGDLLERADHSLAARPSQRVRQQFFDYLAVLLDYPGERPNQ